jgi:hypothetical protein
MPDYNFKNNLKSTLQSKLWSDATSIYCNHVVESEDAETRRSAWPAFPFTLTLVDTANDNIEVIKCTGLADNANNFIAFACDRAQENTTAQTFEIATTSVEHRLTSGALNSIVNDISTANTNIATLSTEVSTSLTSKLNTSVSNITASGINVLFPALKSTSGYQKFANGLIIQWGSVAANATYSFPITFPTAAVSLTFGRVFGGEGTPGADNITTSSFVYRSLNIANVPARYMAIGY